MIRAFLAASRASVPTQELQILVRAPWRLCSSIPGGFFGHLICIPGGGEGHWLDWRWGKVEMGFPALNGKGGQFFQAGKEHRDAFSKTGHIYGVRERCPPLATNLLQDQRSSLPGHPWGGTAGTCPQRHLPFDLVTAMTMMGTPMREESTQMQTLMILALAGVRKSSALTGWHTAM